MEENVSIDTQKLYNQAVSFGVLCRLLIDKSNGDEERKSCLLFAQSYLLSNSFKDEDFNMVLVTFGDVLLLRKIMPNSPAEIRFPEWDPSQIEFREFRDLADAFLILEAFNLCEAEGYRLPPEQYLKPLFGLSGVVMEGVKDGFSLSEDFMKQRYEEFQSKSTKEADDAMRKQIGIFGEFLKELRKMRAN